MKKILSYLSPLEWAAKGIAFLFTSQRLYFSWRVAIIILFLMIAFSGYIFWFYPLFFFTESVLIYDLPVIVSAYYVSLIVGALSFVMVLLGRAAYHLNKKLDQAKKEKLETLKQLNEAYQKFLELK